MFKRWSLLLFLVFFGLEAGAREFSLRYEDYIHLSDAEKDQRVIQLMEFVVELESKYEYDVRKYGEHSPQVQKLKETLLRINQFLIPSAYADSPQNDWHKYAKDFNDLFLKSKEANCIFAGWPSKTYLYDGRHICSHPSKTSSPKINGRYPSPSRGSACGKAGTTKIQCNPTLFGFQDMQKKTLFCVDSSNGAQNSAYHCMKLALSDSDSQKEQRLKMLRENLDKNPEVFKGLQKYVYELCVCKATPEGFNKEYHERIRPHRTCYGMMNMLGAVSCEMDSIEPLKDISIFKELKEKISMSAKQSEIDGLYVDFLKDIPTSAPEEYARMCPNDPGITISTDDKGKTTSGEPNGDPSGTATAGAQGGTPGGADPFGDRYKCDKAICSKKAEAYTCDFVVHDNQTDQSVPYETPKYEAPKDSTVESLSVSFMINGNEQTLTCQPVEFEGETPAEENDDDKKPSLSLEVKKGDKVYNVKAITVNAEGWTLVWKLKLPKTLPEKDVKKGWDDPSAKKDAEPKNDPPAGMATDSEEPAGKKEDTPPTSGEKKEEDSNSPNPTTTTDPEKKDGEEPTSSNNPDQDGGKGTSTPGEKPAGDPGSAPGSKTPDSISQDRKNVDYDVCAQLEKEGQEPTAQTCAKVDKLGNVVPPTQGGMMPQQQAPMRRASDTSAMGIK